MTTETHRSHVAEPAHAQDRRRPPIATTAVGGFYLAMGGIHIGIVAADAQTYRHFADAALFDFVRAGNVCGQHDCAAPRRFYVTARAFKPVAPARKQSHSRPSSSESARGRSPDAGRRSGYDYDFRTSVFAHRVVLSISPAPSL